MIKPIFKNAIYLAHVLHRFEQHQFPKSQFYLPCFYFLYSFCFISVQQPSNIYEKLEL